MGIEMTASMLAWGIHFPTRGAASGYRLETIECNFCSKDDYIFYTKDCGEQPSHEDWLTRAAVHLNRYHLKELEYREKEGR